MVEKQINVRSKLDFQSKYSDNSSGQNITSKSKKSNLSIKEPINLSKNIINKNCTSNNSIQTKETEKPLIQSKMAPNQINNINNTSKDLKGLDSKKTAKTSTMVPTLNKYTPPNNNSSKTNPPKPTISKLSQNEEKDYLTDLENKLNAMELDFNNPMFPRTTLDPFSKKETKNKVTTVFGKVSHENSQPSYHKYEVATRKADILSPNTDITTKNPYSGQEQEVMKQVFLNNINNNKMTLGTKIMMDNERTHALEASTSGIYITWVSQPTSNYNSSSKNCIPVECFRLGSKSKCICNHDFPDHENIVTLKKFSSKCTLCKCRFFAFIPQLPEEVGEYWLPQRRGFKYVEWRGKCKCQHPWDVHDGSGSLKCRECGCGKFNSAFCCVVCNGFWQDHEVVYELRKERLALGKSVDADFLPLNESPEFQMAVYSNIDKSKPQKLREVKDV